MNIIIKLIKINTGMSYLCVILHFDQYYTVYFSPRCNFMKYYSYNKCILRLSTR